MNRAPIDRRGAWPLSGAPVACGLGSWWSRMVDAARQPVAARTVADRLRGARGQWFVGRAAEVELFRWALEADEPPFSVLFVHGPGGVGKTALLDAFGRAAEKAGL